MAKNRSVKKFNKITRYFKGRPFFLAGVIFVAFSWPINHFFLDDYPNNPLEKIERFVFTNIIGIDLSDEDL